MYCVASVETHVSFEASILLLLFVELKEPDDSSCEDHREVHESTVQQRQTHDPLRLSTHFRPELSKNFVTLASGSQHHSVTPCLVVAHQFTGTTE